MAGTAARQAGMMLRGLAEQSHLVRSLTRATALVEGDPQSASRAVADLVGFKHSDISAPLNRRGKGILLGSWRGRFVDEPSLQEEQTSRAPDRTLPSGQDALTLG